MTPLIWAILLFVLALAFLALEMFIPSGGLLAVLSVACIVGSVVFVIIDRGFAVGTVYLLFLAVLIPLVVMGAIQYWPYTPIGRRILNVGPDDEAIPPTVPKHIDLIGKRGHARTKMLPSGEITVDGLHYDAVTEGVAVEAGQPVEVIRVDGTRIVVRALEGDVASGRSRGKVASDDGPSDLLSRQLGSSPEPRSGSSCGLKREASR